jgi:hypothetical protein
MQQPSQHAVTRMLRRARLLPALLALALVASALPLAAHTGAINDHHATALAEGGSTLFTYDPPGVDPTQEFWLDALTSILHRQDCSTLPCRDFYRASFKVNSWRGQFTDNDSILGGPAADSQYIDYTIRLGLYQKDLQTGALTPLSSSNDAFGSQGNFSYGCTGTGREIQVTAQTNKMIVAQLWVWGNRKFYYNGNWYNAPSNTRYWHTTRSMDLDSLYFESGHWANENGLSGFWIRPPDQTNIPNATWRGTCPPGTVMT